VEITKEQQAAITSSMYTYSAVGIGVVVGLGLSCLLGVLFVKYLKERKEKVKAVETAQCVARWTKKIIIERNLEREVGEDDLLTPKVRVEKILMAHSDGGMENVGDDSYEFQLDEEWEFPRELLHLGEELGQGAFGRVVQGTAFKCKIKINQVPEESTCPLVVCADNVEPITVAVKMLKEEHSEADVLDMVEEIEMMKVVGGHVNIVNLLAACTQPSGKPLLAIMEFAELGNLRDFLRNRRGLQEDVQAVSLREMLRYAWQVGRGMEFLSSRRCVHRDLAARNVLVTRDRIVKIADFGLARDVQESDYYRKIGEAKLPVLWMSPESLFAGVSTTKSDVWSFGILMWEIVTCGERPYSGVATEALLDLIKDGYRMSPPPQCPQQLYLIMRECWHIQPHSRPSWDELVNSLLNLYHETLPGVYLDLALPYIPTPPSSPESSSSVLSPPASPCTTSSSVPYPGYMFGIYPLVTPISQPPLASAPPLPSLVRRMSEESGYNSTTGGGGGNRLSYYNTS